MVVSLKDIYQQLDKADKAARTMLAANTEVRSMLAQLHIPEPEAGDFRCPTCGRLFRSDRGLALHAQNVHDGPPVPLSDQELSDPTP